MRTRDWNRHAEYWARLLHDIVSYAHPGAIYDEEAKVTVIYNNTTLVDASRKNRDREISYIRRGLAAFRLKELGIARLPVDGPTDTSEYAMIVEAGESWEERLYRLRDQAMINTYEMPRP